MPVLRRCTGRPALMGWSPRPTRPSPAPAGRVSRARRPGQGRRRAGGRLALDGAASRLPAPKVYAAPIAFNVLPLAGSIVDDGSARPTRSRSCATRAARSSRSRSSRSSGTCVRVPVFTGHSLASTPASPRRSAPSAPASCSPARPAWRSPTSRPRCRPPAGTRRTSAASAATRPSPATGLALFFSSDNLRKGAALNAVQIAELVASADSVPKDG